MLVDPAEDRRGSEPAVLVVDRADPPCIRDADSLACRLDPFVLGDLDEPFAEAPRRLLPEDTGRVSPGIALDDSARDLEIAVRDREPRAVEPE